MTYDLASSWKVLRSETAKIYIELLRDEIGKSNILITQLFRRLSGLAYPKTYCREMAIMINILSMANDGMSDLSEKISELKEVLKNVPRITDQLPSKEYIEHEQMLRKEINEIENAMAGVSLSNIQDKEPFLTEKRRYITIDWVLFKDRNNLIKILYKETPTELAKQHGTEYKPHQEIRDIFSYNENILALISERLPTFVEVLKEEARKQKK